MAQLIYSALASLDGYTADEDGNFDWAAPDEEVHAFVNDLERPIGTYLFGRRMYDVMVYWESAHTLPDQSAIAQDYARIWQSADKVVYSRTLDKVVTERTRIERDFDPVAITQLKEAAGSDISVGGPELAAQALRAGLVDEIQLFVNPVVVGGGTRALPDKVLVHLDLLDEHRFGNGVVYLRYGVRPDSAARTASA
jgi:dihydrofolate reductase